MFTKDATSNVTESEFTELLAKFPVAQQVVLAARSGHVADLQRLIGAKLPQRIYNNALETAADWGQVECVAALIGVATDHTKALIGAANCGSVECVRLLIPGSNPMANESEALLLAALGGYVECMDALYAVSDVPTVLSNLATYYVESQDQWRILGERFEAEQQKITLLNKVTCPKTAGVQRKI